MFFFLRINQRHKETKLLNVIDLKVPLPRHRIVHFLCMQIDEEPVSIVDVSTIILDVRDVIKIVDIKMH